MRTLKVVGAVILCIAVTGITRLILKPCPASMHRVRSTFSPKSPEMGRKARMEFFHRMLRDPATGEIPANIRSRELEFSRSIPRSDQRMLKGSAVLEYTWKSAGPARVGGRTRALAVDVSDAQTIIAGGVSGGIWKSTNGGSSWSLKSDPNHQLSVTALAQDPRSGHTNVWYYGAGEFSGNSASDRSYNARFYGSGLYKSTDNGNTWQLVVNASNLTKWDSYFDYISNIAINPLTGAVYVATNGGYVYRSDDSFYTYSAIIGGSNEHYWTDVAATSDGRIIVTLSQDGYNPRTQTGYTYTKEPGVYVSDNDGITWTDITPATFPEFHSRSVIACSPSDPDIFYILTATGRNLAGSSAEDVRLHQFNLNTGISQDRSANLPAFEKEQDINTQSDYNMVMAVKPDDPDFVLIGATNLYRSTDGFLTPLDNYQSSDKTAWIGGYFYGDDYFMYPNLHPDQHVITFSPANPNATWVGSDGGLSYTADITTTSYATSFPWDSKNNGFVTTQFYTVAIPRTAGDYHIMGGTQDNGTPSFVFSGTPANSSSDLSSGDGSHCYFGSDYHYSSYYNGSIIRSNYNAFGDPNSATEMPAGTQWTVVSPLNATGQLFINPFAIDPNNEEIMFYPADTTMWRNNSLSEIPNWQQDGTNIGWQELTGLASPSTYTFSAMTFTTESPAHRIYYAASSYYGPPKIYRLDNAETAASGAADISIPTAASGAYVHDIAVNPDNGNEILVVMSNYNITGLYHSVNGGASYTAVENNLQGDQSWPGPSLRCAAILPQSSGSPVYFVGTSTGVYSTRNFSTIWEQEGYDEIGNTVVEAMDSRHSDGRVAIGTHGRGVFVADIGGTPVQEHGDAVVPETPQLAQNYPNPFNPSTTINFSMPQQDHVTITVTDITGRQVDILVDKTIKRGNHSVTFNGANLPSGIYFYTLKTGRTSMTKKLNLIK